VRLETARAPKLIYCKESCEDSSQIIVDTMAHQVPVGSAAAATAAAAALTRGYKVLKSWKWMDLFQPNEMKHMKSIIPNLSPSSNVVHQVYPLRVDKRYRRNENEKNVPETTIYWLVDPHLNKKISSLESSGYTSCVQTWISNHPMRIEIWKMNQLEYSKERWNNLHLNDRLLFNKKGWSDRFKDSGIGGIRGWNDSNDAIRVKCLHLHYAHYLVTKKRNAIIDNESSSVTTEDTGCTRKETDFTSAIGSNVQVYNLAGYKVHKELFKL
jgi:hypothetical protein